MDADLGAIDPEVDLEAPKAGPGNLRKRPFLAEVVDFELFVTPPAYQMNRSGTLITPPTSCVPETLLAP